jgi:adenylate cyclase
MTEPSSPRSTGETAADARLRAAFADAERRGLVLTTRVRLASLAVFALWLPFENPSRSVFFYYPFLAGFALIGLVPLALERLGWSAPWQRYVFPVLDVALFTAAVLVPNPLQRGFPPPLMLRFGNEIYLFVFLTAYLHTLSPRVVLWTGVCAATAWAAGTLWILSLPGSTAAPSGATLSTMTVAERMASFADPHLIRLGVLGRQVVVLLVVAASLAEIVRRMRQMVVDQAETERARANLARYFSPNLVEELARSDEPLGAPRRQKAAALFADMVGFTTAAADLSPERVMSILRDFHQRMARCVFDHEGTIDKYIGDALMATFGTPRAGSHDATHALRCARAMIRAIGGWNIERSRDGEQPITIGVGVHYGPVAIGDVGDPQSLAFAVVGDTVNVASRLQSLTRDLHVSLVVSQELIDVVQAEGVVEKSELAGLERVEGQAIRGRDGLVTVWTL